MTLCSNKIWSDNYFKPFLFIKPILQSVTVERPNKHLCTPLVVAVHLLSLGVHKWLKTCLGNSRFQNISGGGPKDPPLPWSGKAGIRVLHDPQTPRMVRFRKGLKRTTQNPVPVTILIRPCPYYYTSRWVPQNINLRICHC